MKLLSKRVVIEGRRFTDSETGEDIAEWSDGAAVHIHTPYDGGEMVVATHEGQMRAALGDWIVKGLEGEFYPVKHSVLVAKYEPLREETDWSIPFESIVNGHVRIANEPHCAVNLTFTPDALDGFNRAERKLIEDALGKIELALCGIPQDSFD